MLSEIVIRVAVTHVSASNHRRGMRIRTGLAASMHNRDWHTLESLQLEVRVSDT
jgi:hypothetical protein